MTFKVIGCIMGLEVLTSPTPPSFMECPSSKVRGGKYQRFRSIGRKGEREMKGTIIALTIALSVAGVYWFATEHSKLFPAKEQTKEDFAVQLAEMNRQADVMSQLMASEKADYAVRLDGYVVAVTGYRSGDNIELRKCIEKADGRSMRMADAKREISKVIKYSPGSAEYADAAYAFNRCARMGE